MYFWHFPRVVGSGQPPPPMATPLPYRTFRWLCVFNVRLVSASQNKPGASGLRTPLTKGQRVSIQKVRKVLRASSYRKDLRGLASRRAAAIIRSQEPPKATRAKKN